MIVNSLGAVRKKTAGVVEDSSHDIARKLCCRPFLVPAQQNVEKFGSLDRLAILLLP